MRLSALILSTLFLNFTFGQDQSPNIILLIGDGMGLTQISTGMYANNNSTVLESFENIGLSKTNAYGQLVTDSAASGTAMATGVKTYNGVLGIDSKNTQVKSILEICEEKGYNSALLATSSIVHATPASFYAQVPSRREYQKIALQLSSHDVDLFIGGGKMHFNKRDDKRNLIEEMNAYHFVNGLDELEKSTSDKIGYFTYKDEPPQKRDGRKPALEDMVSVSLKKMESMGAPFFMLVEGSQIDWGGHANDTEYIVSEFKEFNLAISKALDFAKTDGNTLVVVTADHETGGLALIGGNIKKQAVNGAFNTKGHSAAMVPVFSYGVHSELFRGIYENTAIFDKMVESIK